jgi:hypothetical protein
VFVTFGNPCVLCSNQMRFFLSPDYIWVRKILIQIIQELLLVVTSEFNILAKM